MIGRVIGGGSLGPDPSVVQPALAGGSARWHQVGDTFKRGGRWCPTCGYGVHPPADMAA